MLYDRFSAYPSLRDRHPLMWRKDAGEYYSVNLPPERPLPTVPWRSWIPFPEQGLPTNQEERTRLPASGGEFWNLLMGGIIPIPAPTGARAGS